MGTAAVVIVVGAVDGGVGHIAVRQLDAHDNVIAVVVGDTAVDLFLYLAVSGIRSSRLFHFFLDILNSILIHPNLRNPRGEGHVVHRQAGNGSSRTLGRITQAILNVGIRGLTRIASHSSRIQVAVLQNNTSGPDHLNRSPVASVDSHAAQLAVIRIEEVYAMLGTVIGVDSGILNDNAITAGGNKRTILNSFTNILDLKVIAVQRHALGDGNSGGGLHIAQQGDGLVGGTVTSRSQSLGQVFKSLIAHHDHSAGISTGNIALQLIGHAVSIAQLDFRVLTGDGQRTALRNLQTAGRIVGHYNGRAVIALRRTGIGNDHSAAGLNLQLAACIIDADAAIPDVADRYSGTVFHRDGTGAEAVVPAILDRHSRALANCPHAAVAGVAVNVLNSQLRICHLHRAEVGSRDLEHHSPLQAVQFHVCICQDQLAAGPAVGVVQNKSGSVILPALILCIAGTVDRHLDTVQSQAGVGGDVEGPSPRAGRHRDRDGGVVLKRFGALLNGDILADDILGTAQSRAPNQVDGAADRIQICQRVSQGACFQIVAGNPDRLIVRINCHTAKIRQVICGPAQSIVLIGGHHGLQLSALANIVNDDLRSIRHSPFIWNRNGDLSAALILGRKHGIPVLIHGGHRPVRRAVGILRFLNGQRHAAVPGIVGDAAPGILIQSHSAHVSGNFHILNTGVLLDRIQRGGTHRHLGLSDILARTTAIAGSHVDLDGCSSCDRTIIATAAAFRSSIASVHGGRSGVVRTGADFGLHTLLGADGPGASRFLGGHISSGAVGIDIVFPLFNRGAADVSAAGDLNCLGILIQEITPQSGGLVTFECTALNVYLNRSGAAPVTSFIAALHIYCGATNRE